MLPREQPDRIEIAFDDRRPVANAGLILPVTLAHRLGLSELVDPHVDLGDAPGQANGGDELLMLVASALASGDCIDDADTPRTAGRLTSRLGGQDAVHVGYVLTEFPTVPRVPIGSGEP